MRIEIILYLIGIFLSLLIIVLNIWRAYNHYISDKPVHFEPFIFGVLTLALLIKIPYLMDKPLAVLFYGTSVVLSLIITIIYTLATFK